MLLHTHLAIFFFKNDTDYDKSRIFVDLIRMIWDFHVQLENRMYTFQSDDKAKEETEIEMENGKHFTWHHFYIWWDAHVSLTHLIPTYDNNRKLHEQLKQIDKIQTNTKYKFSVKINKRNNLHSVNAKCQREYISTSCVIVDLSFRFSFNNLSPVNFCKYFG